MSPLQPSPAADLAARPAATSPTSMVESNRASVTYGPLSAAEQAEAAAAAQIFRHPLWPGELASPVNQAGAWLWHGYLGRGMLTLLTSQWKSGKTTLVSVLLARLAEGGQLAGLPVAAGRAAIVSEEGRYDWDRRCRRLGLGKHVGLHCRPFRTRPTRAQWLGMIDAFVERNQGEGLDLVVIDPLSHFLPGNAEMSSVDTVEGLLPLRSLLALGMSILLLHHPRKGRVQEGQAARGSGALASHADIVIEMSCLAWADAADRRRRLRAYSRYDDTCRDLTLGLTADGTDYYQCESPAERDQSDALQVVRLILESLPLPMRMRDMFDHWPDEFKKPDKSTLTRALNRGLAQGLLVRTGSGFRNDAYRYELAGGRAWMDPVAGGTLGGIPKGVSYESEAQAKE